jgi:hypothetical protein
MYHYEEGRGEDILVTDKTKTDVVQYQSHGSIINLTVRVDHNEFGTVDDRSHQAVFLTRRFWVLQCMTASHSLS